MTTDEEIERRVEETDTPRTEKRSTAAKQVAELAERRSAIAEQLDDIERELGDILVAAQEVMDIKELARFTDVPATDLTRWLTSRKTTRTKSKKTTASALNSARQEPAMARTEAPTPPTAPDLRNDAADDHTAATATAM
jgi:hypothetical protein